MKTLNLNHTNITSKKIYELYFPTNLNYKYDNINILNKLSNTTFNNNNNIYLRYKYAKKLNIFYFTDELNNLTLNN